MKKTLSILAITIAAVHISAFAQTQLPNSDFESWASAANGTDSLIGWSSGNAVVMTPVISLYKTADAHHGNNAALVVTAPFGFVQYTTIGILVNGTATFSYGGGGNTVNVSYTSGGGVPISYKPEALSGFYKYETNAVDHGLAKVLLTRYNTGLQQRDTVSYGSYTFTDQPVYTPFSIPLTDQMPGVMPDSITTFFYSSDSAIVPQFSVFSSLYLDSLTLSPVSATDVKNIPSAQARISLFPNPNDGCFTITKKDQKPLTAGVYDVTGKKLKDIRMLKEQTSVKVDLQSLAPGTYYLVADEDKGAVQKMIIAR